MAPAPLARICAAVTGCTLLSSVVISRLPAAGVEKHGDRASAAGGEGEACATMLADQCEADRDDGEQIEGRQQPGKGNS